jgi:hypothetical protein
LAATRDILWSLAAISKTVLEPWTGPAGPSAPPPYPRWPPAPSPPPPPWDPPPSPPHSPGTPAPPSYSSGTLASSAARASPSLWPRRSYAQNLIPAAEQPCWNKPIVRTCWDENGRQVDTGKEGLMTYFYIIFIVMQALYLKTLACFSMAETTSMVGLCIHRSFLSMSNLLLYRYCGSCHIITGKYSFYIFSLKSTSRSDT